MLGLLNRVERRQKMLDRWLPPAPATVSPRKAATWKGLHPHQMRVVREAGRFNVVAAGRRWGKSTLGIDRMIVPAMAGFPVGWYSPTYKALEEIWRDVRRELRPFTVSKSEQQHRLELVSGGVVDMWSLSEPDASRGRRYKLVVIDEAAMVRDLGDAWNAVIRPTLTDFQGGAWFLSTPRGMNFFRVIYERGGAGGAASGGVVPAGEWRSWRMPTSANPYIKPEEIAAAQREMPERIFAQEYLAEFLDSAGGVFRRVRECATAERRESAVAGSDGIRHTYVFGVDWGRSNDFTVIVAVDEQERAVVAMDRFNQIDYVVQRDRLRAMYERFRPHTVLAESNSIGQPNIEMLRRDGLPVRPFTTTAASKANAIEALALALERADIRLLADPVLVGEMLAYEQERMPGGMMRYGAPAGMHDDCVMALAIAWQGVAGRQHAKPIRSFQG